MYRTTIALKRTLACLAVGLCLLATVMLAYVPAAHAQEEPAAPQIEVKFDKATGIHYVEDPEYPNDPMVLYCMNNDRLWPHATDHGLTPPPYYEGYLRPDMFKSEADYQECLRKIRKVLYAGFPYNGERLYGLVEEGEVPTISETEYNRLLVTPPQLIAAFPYLAHHEFKLSDYYTNKTEHLDAIERFISDVGNLYASGGATSNGLKHEDIITMPFYHASWCISLAMNSADTTPEEEYARLYKSSFFVTHSQAYDATQSALWAVLDSYGVEGNSYGSENLHEGTLARGLYTYAQRGDVLSVQPDPAQVRLVGDLTFSYNETDGMWHSGKIRVEEPKGYHGVYELALPKGVTALCEHLTYVYAGEEYELVSDHAPVEGETFSINASIPWMKEMKQYRPSSVPVESDKEFQSMAGAVVYKTKVSHSFALRSQPPKPTSVVLKAKKQLSGREMVEGEFFFELLEGEQVLQAVGNGAPESDGTALIEFDAIEYTEVGEHDYVIREVVGDADGVTYDESEFAIHVSIVNDGKGSLKATISEAEGREPVFKNSYKRPGVPMTPLEPSAPVKPSVPMTPLNPATPASPAAPSKPAVPSSGNALPKTGDASLFCALGSGLAGTVLATAGAWSAMQRKRK